MGGLKRTLGFGGLAFYGIGMILGAGIYSILGKAANVAGYALWQAFVMGSLAALLTGLSYAELATMYPKAGAEYVYLGKAWPRAPTLAGAVGWIMVGAGAATAATVALAFAGYATLFLPLPTFVVAIALLAAVGALNVVGVRESSWANIVFTLVEAGGLVALVVVGLRDPDVGRAVLAAPHPGLLPATGLIFFAFLGFEHIANLAEEAKRPERDLPRAIVLAVVVTTILYVLVAIASLALLSPAQLAASPSPLADAMRARAPALVGALGGIALFATANTALIAITAVSRILLGMAEGGDAPAVFARTLPRRKTPAPAILLACLGGVALLPLGGVGAVGSVASLMALVAFASINATVIRLRLHAPRQERPFRTPLAVGAWPVLPLAGLAAVALLATQFDRVTYLVTGGVVLVGAATARAGRSRWTRA